jgi:hypothetical protein
VNSPTPIFILETKTTEGATNAGVVQDKAPQVRSTAGSEQPYIPQRNAVDRPAQHGSEKRQTAHVSSRIPHHVKTGLRQIAQANGWTESKVVATACEAYLEHDLGEKFGVRLAAQVTSALHKSLQSHSNRTANIGLQAYYVAEQARILNIHILRFLTDLVDSPDELTLIIKVAQEEAWKHMTKLHSKKADDPAREETYAQWQS